MTRQPSGNQLFPPLETEGVQEEVLYGGDFFDDDLPGGDGFGETYDDKCAGHEHGSFHDDSTILCTRRRDALYGRSMLIGVLAYCECLVVDWLNY